MGIKRFVIGTLVGGITMYVVGYLIWELAFATFFAANVGSATGVARDANLEDARALRDQSHEDRLAVVDHLDSMVMVGYLRGRDIIDAYNRALMQARAAERGEA